MKSVLTTALIGMLAGSAAFADGHRTAAPEGAAAYIISPADGDTVSNPVTIVFGLEGLGVAPAGREFDDTGHYHLLINTDPTAINMDGTLPATVQIVHFGGGQTQVTKELPTGTHTLQRLVGNWSHVPHDPPVMSEAITVTVA